MTTLQLIKTKNMNHLFYTSILNYHYIFVEYLYIQLKTNLKVIYKNIYIESLLIQLVYDKSTMTSQFRDVNSALTLHNVTPCLLVIELKTAWKNKNIDIILSFTVGAIQTVESFLGWREILLSLSRSLEEMLIHMKSILGMKFNKRR